jgi:hypothetical protein
LKNGDRQHRPRADQAGSIGSVRHPAWDGEASPHFSRGGPIRRAGGLGRFKVEFEGFSEILDRFFFRGTLAGNVDFQALGHVPITLTLDSRGKWSLHGLIVSHEGWDSVVRERSAPSGWMTMFWIGFGSRSMMRAVEVIRT